MRQCRMSLIGRDDDVEVISEVLRAIGTESAQTLLINGGPGVGKTAVLELARRTVLEEGVRVLRLPWETSEGAAGVTAVADAVCDVLANIHDGRLPARVTAIRRAQSRGADRGGELTPLSTMSEVLADAARHTPFALVLDGTERIPPRTASALGLLLRVFRPVGIPVVMAGRPMAAGPGHGDVVVAADRVLDLPPLPADDVHALIEQRVGRPVETTLVEAVLRALGPLEGNPRAVLSVLTALDEGGRLLELDGHVGLTEPERGLPFAADVAEPGRLGPPGMPRDHGRMETAAVLARLTDRAELRLEDLQLLARRPGPRGRTLATTLDQLVRDRVLTADPDGRIAFTVPALAAALRTLPAICDVRSLHAGIVASAVDRLGAATAGTHHPCLAGHVSAAGSRVGDAQAVPLLLAAARTYAEAQRPEAVRAFQSALHRLPPHDPGTPDALREAAEAALRHGDHHGALSLAEPLLARLRLPHRTGREDVEFTARAWLWAALHEHRAPIAGDVREADRAALWRVPGAASLAALGGLYGIGQVSRPVPLPASDADEARAERRPSAGGIATGPLPSPAEVRLLATAMGSGIEVERALRGLPYETIGHPAVDRLRNAAAHGDLVGALEAVLGDRYVMAGDSTAVQYHAMVRDYLAGHWDDALSSARRIERRSRSGGPARVSQMARALAAEIHGFRGDIRRARAWLGLIPDTVVHPLVDRARLGVRYWSGEADQALEDGWTYVRRARQNGLLMGVDRVLLRIAAYALYDGRLQAVQRALEELETLDEETGSGMSRESLLLVRGVLHGDRESLLAGHRLVRKRGDALLEVHCHQWLAEADDDPQQWLAEATRHAHRLGIGQPLRTLIGRAARRRNVTVPLPRRRAVNDVLSEPDLRLIEVISGGATNRQIAARLACSEKTVEQRLTRLFQRTGCRSRAELAAAWLDGGLARRGLVPKHAPPARAGGGAPPSDRVGR
ncbi:LuxR family transcriptional regulator [Streptomyces sp. 5-6(2022)]|uniref:LuxR family transcriptional regulator n=1 Tax=Streptomyces sp. 5-6(2022) TaxID=2936510 RepID=UPI0023B88815|nr:LuxR family transcriptional regulator [Streptomyces sp. 5-6(2022)]